MTAKKVNIELLTDLPIKSEVDDKFGRKDFVNAIADIIYSQSTEVNVDGNPVFKNVEENLIIGLYGSWGHGKSSVINLLDEKLKEKQLQTVYFNPWMYGSENQLIAALLKVILHHTSLTVEPLEKLSSLFKKYFSLIAIADQQTADIGKALIETFDTKKDLITAEEIKEAIDNILSGTANPLTIFIDDVDRLSKDEIHVLFKTLRLIASFKHVIYVVAFDFDMVSKSIKEKYVDGNEEDGKAFLEKIIQIPIRIPEIDKTKLIEFATNILLKSTDVKISELHLFKLIIENYYHTPRDIIRFVNSFRFTKHFFNGSINDDDLIFLELARNKMHVFFQIIKIYYNAISSLTPHDTFEKGLRQYYKIHMPDFITQQGNINKTDKIYTLYDMIFDKVFGTSLIHPRFTPIASQAKNANGVLLEEYLLQCQNDPPESLRNPYKLITYFEKSAEINQDEATTEQ